MLPGCHFDPAAFQANTRSKSLIEAVRARGIAVGASFSGNSQSGLEEEPEAHSDWEMGGVSPKASGSARIEFAK
jgi:hypothetical protein